MNSRRTRHRNPLVAAAAVLALLVVMPVAPASAATPAPESAQVSSGAALLTADLDGRPIELVKVGSYYCHDFDYPRIHCFATPAALEDAVSTTLVAMAATDTNYVLIFENTYYQGAYMYISSDYSILATVGWNDRISSFKSVNSGSGKFWTDWFYGGTSWGFCCNVQTPFLGTFNDTFSSVYRT